MRFSRIDCWSGLLFPPSRDLPDLGFEPVSPMSPALAGKPYTEPPGKSICIHMHVLSHFSCVQFFVTQWTVALQAPQSMGFSREEYWSGWPDPAGDLLDPGSTPGYTHTHTHTHTHTQWLSSKFSLAWLNFRQVSSWLWASEHPVRVFTLENLKL